MKYVIVLTGVLAGFSVAGFVWHGTLEKNHTETQSAFGFAALDRDGDGVVTNAEYTAARHTRPGGFRLIDLNRDGEVTADEYEQAVRRIHRNPAAYTGVDV